MEIPSLSILTFHCPSDARSQRGYEILQSNSRLHVNHDERKTLDILLFMRRHAATTPEDVYWPSSKEESALATAFELYESRQVRTRWLLEPRLLAGEEVGSIAIKVGARGLDIKSYASTFFDARKRLALRDSVVLDIMAPTPLLDCAAYEAYGWKSLGYWRGVQARDDYFRVKSPTASEYAGHGTPWLSSYYSTLLEQKAVTALQTLDASKEETALKVEKPLVRADAGQRRCTDQARGKVHATSLPERGQTPLEGSPRY